MAVETQMPQVLADLEARAGASDQDREQWLRERNSGVTATQIRDLKIGAVRTNDLVKAKLADVIEEDLSHVSVIGWGKDRESVIAEQLRGEGFEPESRVFHHPENSRYLASPDGVHLTWDEALWVSEIKTAAHDLVPGTPEFARKGYLYQVQWVMFVLGAERCRFVVEERIEMPDRSFQPGALHRHWIERDEAIIAELVQIADDFLAELDRQRDEGAPEIDEELDTHAVNYLRAIDEEKRWKALKEEHYAAIVAAGKSQESPLARVTYTAAKPGESVEVEEIDYDAARATHFGQSLFEELQAVTARWNEHLQGFISTKTVEGKGRPASARITAGKATKERKA
ncbi:YqaJ viral recombinase family protein [Microbacterium resistens]